MTCGVRPVSRLNLGLLQGERCSGGRYSRTHERWIGCRLTGKPLFWYTGTLDRMLSRLVHPYPTLRFTRNNSFVLSISGSRYSPTQERSICCRLVPHLHNSLSLSLSIFLSLASLRSRVHFGLYSFLYCYIYYFFSWAFFNDSGSVSCVRPDTFVMHSASSGTPGSHTLARSYPVTKHTVANGHTTVSFTLTRSRALSRFVLDERLT